MKKLKNIVRNSGILLLSCLLLVMYETGEAQNQQKDHRNPPPVPDSTQIVKMVNELSKELSLTESQKEKISELHFTHFKEAKIMMENGKAEHEKNKKTMHALRKDFETQIGELLNEKQKAELAEYMKNRRPPKDKKQKPRR